MEQSHIPVWFVCKICQESVDSINDFISHKRLEYFADFQKRKCIVFEEKLDNNIGSNFNKVLVSDTPQQNTSDVKYVPLNPEFNQLVEFEDESEHNLNIYELHPDHSSTSLLMPLSTVGSKSELQNQTTNSSSRSTRKYFQSSPQEVLTPLDFLTDAQFYNDIKSYTEENVQSIESQSYYEEINPDDVRDFVRFEAANQEIGDFEDIDILSDAENSNGFEIHNPKNVDNLNSCNEKSGSQAVQSPNLLPNSNEDEENSVIDIEDISEDILKLKVKTSFSLYPVVRIQKLTPKEIQNACSKVTASTSSIRAGGKNDDCEIHLKMKPKSEPKTEGSIFDQEASNSSQLSQCPFGNKIVDSESGSKIHERICKLKKDRVTKVVKFDCDVCLKQLKSAQILKCHKWTIHNNVDVVEIGSKSVMCNYPGCSKSFENERFLNCHKAKVHMLPSERKYVCKEENCGKAYKSNKILRYHLRLKHEKGKSLPIFNCEICLKTFAFSARLQSHLLVHSDYRPFICQINGCKLAFKRRLELERHGMTQQ